MKFISSHILFFLFFLLFNVLPAGFGAGRSIAADINATIVDGNMDVYQHILDKIGARKDKDDNLLMEEMFARKIISLLKSGQDMKIVLPAPGNMAGYSGLFLKYVEWSAMNSELRTDIHEAEERLKVLKNQIGLSEKGDKGLRGLQLQYAFYYKGIQLYRKRAEALDKAMKQAPSIFVKALALIDFDISQIDSRFKAVDADLKKGELKIYKLKIERDRLDLLGRPDAASRVDTSIAGLQTKRQALLRKKLEWLFLKFSHHLKKKDKRVFVAGQTILNVAGSMKNGTVLKQDLTVLLQNMERLVLGTARTLHGLTVQEIKALASQLWHTINKPFMTIAKTPVSVLKILMFLLVITAGLLSGRFFKSNIRKFALKNQKVNTSTLTLISNLGYYTIIIAGFFFALNVLGINLSSIALVAGALSVGIGFGLQNIVSNFVSGIILLFERSVKIGDFIEFSSDLRGVVKDIKMRSITINTNSNIDVIVPNQDLIQNRVINWTMNDEIRRFEIPFGVAYGTNPQKVTDVVLKAVENSGFTEVYISARGGVKVIMTGLGDSSIEFMLFIWIKGAWILHPRSTASKFLILIYNALRENGIEIPFPQRDLHIRSVEAELPVRVETGEEGLQAVETTETTEEQTDAEGKKS